MPLDALSTPSLLVERDRLDRNLDRMQARADDNDVALRPHAKTHKSVALAKRQRRRGASGITVATVGEAERFVQAGMTDVRLAYPVVGRDKHERLSALWDDAQLSFTVDTKAGIEQAAAFYAEKDRPMDVLLEIDVGHGRCGVPWSDGERAVALARRVTELPGLRLVGLLTHAGQAYDGPAEGETEEDALERIAHNERDCMLAMALRLADADVPGVKPGAFEISIGSTPSMSAFTNAERGGFQITEIRPGNYVVYDAMQVGLGAASLDDCALTVYTTVVSTQAPTDGPDRAFVDAGKKVFTTDTGYGTDAYGTVLADASSMLPDPALRLAHLSEEHGWLEGPSASSLEVGDRLRIVPNHACVTIANHSAFHVVDGASVTDSWTVDARGW